MKAPQNPLSTYVPTVVCVAAAAPRGAPLPLGAPATVSGEAMAAPLPYTRLPL
eukprot:COSAG01_NODE_44786_length_415_cov_2.693038_1_plen_52_part_10